MYRIELAAQSLAKSERLMDQLHADKPDLPMDTLLNEVGKRRDDINKDYFK